MARTPKKPVVNVTGAQKDGDTEKWFFIVWGDEERTRERFRSKPIYDEEEDAHAAAAEWMKRTPPSSNFSWGQPRRKR